MSGSVLVIDDEDAIRLLVRRALARDGHDVLEAHDAAEGLSLAKTRKPAVVLLDMGLPDRDGLELVQPLVDGGAAVIVVTARDETAEKVAALDLGADDYVTKPFDTDELLARVRSAQRRHRPGGDGTRSIDGLVIDEQAHRVTVDGNEVHLTPKEFALLAMLARNPGRVVTHATLLRDLWGPAHVHDVEYLRVAVRALRLKIEADPSSPKRLRNEPGVGYRFG